jgi:hypothetical protein
MCPLSMLLLVTRLRFGSRSVPETGDAAWTVRAVIRLGHLTPSTFISYLLSCGPSPEVRGVPRLSGSWGTGLISCFYFIPAGLLFQGLLCGCGPGR